VARHPRSAGVRARPERRQLLARTLTTVHIPWEPLDRGPIGREIAIIDYDAGEGGATGCGLVSSPRAGIAIAAGLHRCDKSLRLRLALRVRLRLRDLALLLPKSPDRDLEHLQIRTTALYPAPRRVDARRRWSEGHGGVEREGGMCRKIGRSLGGARPQPGGISQDELR
jgi:hypothetical protein